MLSMTSIFIMPFCSKTYEVHPKISNNGLGGSARLNSDNVRIWAQETAGLSLNSDVRFAFPKFDAILRRAYENAVRTTREIIDLAKQDVNFNKLLHEAFELPDHAPQKAVKEKLYRVLREFVKRPENRGAGLTASIRPQKHIDGFGVNTLNVDLFAAELKQAFPELTFEGAEKSNEPVFDISRNDLLGGNVEQLYTKILSKVAQQN